jgi:pseudoazurin
MKMVKTIVQGFLVAGLAFGSQSFAAEHVVKGAGAAFEPKAIKVAVGDTVKFTNMAGHDTASIDGLIPEGAKGWKSKMGEDMTVTVDKEGVYIYKCSPHVSAGMVGAIVAGSAKNLDAIEKSPENKGMIAKAIAAAKALK